MSKITVDTSQMERVGNNVKATVQEGQLVLVIDAGEQIGPSSSGKMIGYASTSGFTSLPGGFKGNLYIGKKI